MCRAILEFWLLRLVYPLSMLHTRCSKLPFIFPHCCTNFEKVSPTKSQTSNNDSTVMLWWRYFCLMQINYQLGLYRAQSCAFVQHQRRQFSIYMSVSKQKDTILSLAQAAVVANAGQCQMGSSKLEHVKTADHNLAAELLFLLARSESYCIFSSSTANELIIDCGQCKLEEPSEALASFVLFLNCPECTLVLVVLVRPVLGASAF